MTISERKEVETHAASRPPSFFFFFLFFGVWVVSWALEGVVGTREGVAVNPSSS